MPTRFYRIVFLVIGILLAPLVTGVGTPAPFAPQTTTPTCEITPELKLGERGTIACTGFTPSADVRVIFHRPDGTTGENLGKADEHGGFNGTFTVAPDRPPGQWTLYLTDVPSGHTIEAPFVVTPSATVVPTAAPATRTGAPASGPREAIPSATLAPTAIPTPMPATPTVAPTVVPATAVPSATLAPTVIPTTMPATPTAAPTSAPIAAVPSVTAAPTAMPTPMPAAPTAAPVFEPTFTLLQMFILTLLAFLAGIGGGVLLSGGPPVGPEIQKAKIAQQVAVRNWCQGWKCKEGHTRKCLPNGWPKSTCPQWDQSVQGVCGAEETSTGVYYCTNPACPGHGSEKDTCKGFGYSMLPK